VVAFTAAVTLEELGSARACRKSHSAVLKETF
jgi:hypothetical protein